MTDKDKIEKQKTEKLIDEVAEALKIASGTDINRHSEAVRGVYDEFMKVRAPEDINFGLKLDDLANHIIQEKPKGFLRLMAKFLRRTNAEDIMLSFWSLSPKYDNISDKNERMKTFIRDSGYMGARGNRDKKAIVEKSNAEINRMYDALRKREEDLTKAVADSFVNTYKTSRDLYKAFRLVLEEETEPADNPASVPAKEEPEHNDKEESVDEVSLSKGEVSETEEPMNDNEIDTPGQEDQVETIISKDQKSEEDSEQRALSETWLTTHNRPFNIRLIAVSILFVLSVSIAFYVAFRTRKMAEDYDSDYPKDSFDGPTMVESSEHSYLEENKIGWKFSKKYDQSDRDNEDTLDSVSGSIDISLPEGESVEEYLAGLKVATIHTAAEHGLRDSLDDLIERLDPDANNEDFNAKVAAISNKAKQGDVASQVLMAIYHIKGYGVVADEVAAFQYSQVAAGQDASDGQTILGICYQYGIGTKIDETKARECYAKAIEQNNPVAITNMGLLKYLAYYNSAKNPTKESDKNSTEYSDGFEVYDCIDLFTKAADSGNARAEYYLAAIYITPECGVIQDKAQGLYWLQESARKGYGLAEKCLEEWEIEREE